MAGQQVKEAFATLAAGVQLTDQIDVSRGDMLVHIHNVPRVDRTVDAMVVWMNQTPLEQNKTYVIKHCTSTLSAVSGPLRYAVDVNTLHRRSAETLNLNEIGRCVFTMNRPIAFDSYRNNRPTGSFIIIDRVSNNTVGAGLILDRDASELVLRKKSGDSGHRSEHIRRHSSEVTFLQRSKLFAQEPACLWFTGLTGTGKSTLAYATEKRLFQDMRPCWVLDGENARLGISRDLSFSADDRSENIRRAAEIAKILNDAGLIAICSFISPYTEDREMARRIIGEHNFMEIYLSAPIEVCRDRNDQHLYDLAQTGELKAFSGVTAPYEVPQSPELSLATHQLSVNECVDRIIQLLQKKT